MAYVPGYDNDLFVSYAHGDDRSWIRNFVELLAPALKEQLGVAAKVWVDRETLESSVDYREEIPQSAVSSALFLLLTSPHYIRSSYCVDVECKAFEGTIPEKRARFETPEFRNELFAFRASILPVDNNEHWKLFEGLTDYTFHDGAFRLPLIRNGAFEAEFRRLVMDISHLLKRMRNHSTPVFLYPRDPDEDIAEAHRMLRDELLGHGYRVLPDSLVGIERQMQESALAVFLLGAEYDARLRDLLDATGAKPEGAWVVWRSPAAEATRDPNQRMLLARLEHATAPRRRDFNGKVRADQLKREVMDLLRPSARVLASRSGKRRIALVYDDRKGQELANAADIRFRWDREFDFELPSDGMPPKAATADGVLLVWGEAEEAWCSDQFERLSSARVKGLCVFDPEKRPVVEQIRRSSGAQWYITEHYGRFDPQRLDPFFDVLRHRGEAGTVP